MFKLSHRLAAGMFGAICWLALFSGGAAGQAGAPLPRGHVFFQADFEKAEARKEWAGGGKLEEGFKGGQSLCIERSAGAPKGSAMASIVLPAEKMRGYMVYGYATVRAENVTKKPQAWNGIKFMMPIDSPGGKSWPQAAVDAGSFDWKQVSFSARVPDDATSVSLCLGLEEVSGKVWFDNVRIVVGKPPMVITARPATGPIFKGHNLPRLRGAMISTNIDEAGLKTLGQDWGANLIRWQLIRYGPAAKISTPAEFDAWLERELAKLDVAIPLCRKFGIHVLIDLHSPFGGKPTGSGYVGTDSGLFTDKAAQDKFVRVWEYIAKRYKGNPVIWGYDLANEPVEGTIGEDCDDWHDLAQRTAKAVRAIDAERAIIIEPPDWGNPAGLIGFAPIDVPNVVYSVHMYIPHRFTHQGVSGASTPFVYPGLIDGTQWDKAKLAAALKPAVDFQKAYNVHIYVGEFSAIRWAPDNSAQRYLSDVIDICEANGWDWSYHAFREWSGWSVEHGEDRADEKPAAQPTGRQKLLHRWFGENRKPQWQP